MTSQNPFPTPLSIGCLHGKTSWKHDSPGSGKQDIRWARVFLEGFCFSQWKGQRRLTPFLPSFFFVNTAHDFWTCNNHLETRTRRPIQFRDSNPNRIIDKPVPPTADLAFLVNQDNDCLVWKGKYWLGFLLLLKCAT